MTTKKQRRQQNLKEGKLRPSWWYGAKGKSAALKPAKEDKEKA